MIYRHSSKIETRKPKVGHCDLIPLQIFFHFHNFQKEGPIDVPCKVSAKYT